ncbi:4579_t:CDS:2, partial [Acaulospora colombiana]
NVSASDSQKKHNDPTAHVSVLLEQLRHETRPKNLVTADAYSLLPLPACNYLMREQAELEQRTRREIDLTRQRVSGPAPPKSWQRAWCSEVGNPNREVPSLLSICVDTIAINIELYTSHRYFSNLPTHLKQYILSSMSIHNPLTNESLPLFANDPGYEELDIAYSNVTLECLKKYFWKVVKEKDVKSSVVEDWEDLIDHGDNDNAVDILSVQRFRTSRDHTTKTEAKTLVDAEKTFKKYVSILPDLRRLNCGFTVNISAIPLSTLIVSTLPLLTHLSIAGCFDQEVGPHALRVLSGLFNLLFWEISYCKWVNDRILLQSVNWDRDLKSLKTLVAIECGDWDNLEEVRRQLSHHRRMFDLLTEITCI